MNNQNVKTLKNFIVGEIKRALSKLDGCKKAKDIAGESHSLGLLEALRTVMSEVERLSD